MQTYDFLMLFVLVGLTIYGYAKGMAWQVAYLTSFFASYFVAVQFSDRLAPVLSDVAPWNKFAAMAVIYIATSLAIWVVFRYVRKGIDKVKLQSFDRQIGAFVGAARGVLWCVGITFVVMTVLPDMFNTLKQHVVASQSGRYIARVLDKADSVMPPEVHQVIGPHLNRLEQELNQPQAAPPAGQPLWTPPTVAAPTQGWPATDPGWPAGQTPTGTPAQPTGWPSQPTNQPAWPQQ